MATVSATYLGDLRVECVHNQSGTRIITDAPTDNQGKGASFSPTDLCATALGACAMTIIGIYAQSHGVDITGTTMNITGAQAPPRHDACNRTHGERRFGGHPADERRLDRQDAGRQMGGPL